MKGDDSGVGGRRGTEKGKYGERVGEREKERANSLREK